MVGKAEESEVDFIVQKPGGKRGYRQVAYRITSEEILQRSEIDKNTNLLYNVHMANRNKHLNPRRIYNPPRCWVGDVHKIIYDTKEEAELAANVAAYDHGIKTSLKVYKCSYADHYHLSSG